MASINGKAFQCEFQNGGKKAARGNSILTLGGFCIFFCSSNFVTAIKGFLLP